MSYYSRMDVNVYLLILLSYQIDGKCCDPKLTLPSYSICMHRVIQLTIESIMVLWCDIGGQWTVVYVTVGVRRRGWFYCTAPVSSGCPYTAELTKTQTFHSNMDHWFYSVSPEEKEARKQEVNWNDFIFHISYKYII